MADYHAMYLKLAAAQADAIDALRKAMDILIRAHREAEEILLSAPQTDILILNPDDGKE